MSESTTDPEPIVPGSGPDGRFIADWLAQGRRRHDDGTGTMAGGMMMELAQRHKRPIRELKAVIAEWKRQRAEEYHRRAAERRKARGLDF
jgi:hypothetical protein